MGRKLLLLLPSSIRSPASGTSPPELFLLCRQPFFSARQAAVCGLYWVRENSSLIVQSKTMHNYEFFF